MKEKLYLIDGHALIFKMYYAFLRRPMINSKGADMSILFGFTKYILELISRKNPEYLAIAFDPPGGTFRNKMYPEYKATRAETPQLVIDALEPLMELCNALGITTLMVPSFEADDVIGSMAKREAAAGLDVYMVTPDKDYGQLIDENIHQVKPGKAGGEDELVDVKAVCEKYGIQSPEQVIEMLAICGDTADNVPGVKGVGEVGAGKLISKYGTVENIYAHIDELTPRQQAQFKEAQDHIKLSHDLVTIKTDIELPEGEQDMRVNLRYTAKVAELFDKYEFNSLKRLVPEMDGGLTAVVSSESKKIVLEEVTPEQILKAAQGSGVVGIWTMSYEPGLFGEISGVAIAVPQDVESLKSYVSYSSPESFKDILEDSSISKFGYDLKSQLNQLKNVEIDLNGRLFDVSLMHYLINPEKNHSPEVLAKSYISVDLDDEIGRAHV